jgi:hypothetical protein
LADAELALHPVDEDLRCSSPMPEMIVSRLSSAHAKRRALRQAVERDAHLPGPPWSSVDGDVDHRPG